MSRRLAKFCALASMMLLVACSTLDSYDKSIAYKKIKPAKPLEYPPDLINNTLLNESTDTLSVYNQIRSFEGVNSQEQDGILPKFADIRFVREGNQRFLSAKATPSELWLKIKNFWQDDIGVEIDYEYPTAGIISTKWAENRAELNSGIIRQYLRKVIDFAFSTGTRDKFFTRLERNDDKTEIFIDHAQMVEKLKNNSNESTGSTIWTGGKSNPVLEGEILSRLLIYLGAPKNEADASKAVFKPATIVSIETTPSGAMALRLKMDMQNAWRAIASSLSSSGSRITDLNQNERLINIDFIDKTDQNKGFFLFRQDPVKTSHIIKLRYINESQTIVDIFDKDNKPDTRLSAVRLMQLIQKDI